MASSRLALVSREGICLAEGRYPPQIQPHQASGEGICVGEELSVRILSVLEL